MDFNAYQIAARRTAIYPQLGDNLWYPALGLAGESGEVAEKVKKVYRDHGGVLTNEEREKLCKELGVKWIFPIDLNPMFRRLSFPFTRPQVTLDGNVYSCCYMIGRGKTWFDGHLVDIPSEDYILGNAFKQDFREIWYSDAMNELRDTVKRTERKRGTVITREELKEMREHIGKGRFAYCEACLPRWGMACS